MNIAHISYEYPPDTAGGGIATYVEQIVRVLSNRGHTVHVFCGSPTQDSEEIYGNIHVHRIKSTDTHAFKWQVVDKFSEVHGKEKIDIMESPEYNADGLIVKKLFPDIPLVVRLHTPHFLLNRIISYKMPFAIQCYRFLISIYLQCKKLVSSPQFFRDEEHEICKIANEIHSPSVSLAGICSVQWKLEKTKVKVIPYAFHPSEELLKIPMKDNPGQKIFYLGGLQIRKGIYIFESVIPAILEKYPSAEFHFIGRISVNFHGEPFDQYLRRKCEKWSNRMFFRTVVYQDIPKELAKADICIFPSLWENFPNVCLEAMSAGKTIIASQNGGMKDMLEDSKAGVLVDPKNAEMIIHTINELFTSPSLIQEYGIKAREAVLSKYNSEKIGETVSFEFKRLCGK